MKTNRMMMVAWCWIAGSGWVVAAQNVEPRHTDKRVIVSANSVPGAPNKPARDPVTFLGVAVAPADPVLASQLRLPEGQGLVVNVVEPDSPAAKAGLQQYDILAKLDDQILIDPRQLSVLVRNRKEGEKVTLTYVRAGAEARATATLATHVPGPVPVFHWIGGGSDEFNFRVDKFGPASGTEFRASETPHGMPFPMHLRGPGQRVDRIGAHAGRVMIYPPEAAVVFSDEAGSLEMRMDENGQNLTAKSAEGEITFSGPVTTPEQRAALPEDLRKRLEKFEGLKVFEAPVAAPGVPMFTPAGRAEPLSPVL